MSEQSEREAVETIAEAWANSVRACYREAPMTEDEWAEWWNANSASMVYRQHATAVYAAPRQPLPRSTRWSRRCVRSRFQTPKLLTGRAMTKLMKRLW